VADTGNNRIRRIIPAGEVSTLAGSTRGYLNATGTAARFNRPQGIAVTGDNLNLYVADTGTATGATASSRIRKIASAGTRAISTIAGTAAVGHADTAAAVGDTAAVEATFDSPSGVAADSDGNLYVTDTAGHTIRKIEYK